MIVADGTAAIFWQSVECYIDDGNFLALWLDIADQLRAILGRFISVAAGLCTASLAGLRIKNVDRQIKRER